MAHLSAKIQNPHLKCPCASTSYQPTDSLIFGWAGRAGMGAACNTACGVGVDDATLSSQGLLVLWTGLLIHYCFCCHK